MIHNFFLLIKPNNIKQEKIIQRILLVFSNLYIDKKFKKKIYDILYR